MRPIRIPGAAVVLALVALACAGCSKHDEPSKLAPASSSARPGSGALGTVPTSTATVPPSTGGCPSPGAPGTLQVSTATGDADGDGTRDTVTVFGTGTADDPAPYRVRVALGDGHGAAETAITDAEPGAGQQVRALGVAIGLVFVQVGSGASAGVVGMFVLDGCDLARVTAPGSQAPAKFAIGGTVTSLSGLRCEPVSGKGGARLEVLNATSDDGVTYTTSEQSLRVEQHAFVADGPPATGTLQATDAALQSFAILACPGVQSP